MDYNGNGMELRNGVWTSQTRSDDASDIIRLARSIIHRTDDPQVKHFAQRIIRHAQDLE